MKSTILLLVSSLFVFTFFYFPPGTIAATPIEFQFHCPYAVCLAGGIKLNDVKIDSIGKNPCVGNVLQLGNTYTSNVQFTNGTSVSNTNVGLFCESSSLFICNMTSIYRDVKLITSSNLSPTQTIVTEFNAQMATGYATLWLQMDYGAIDNLYHYCYFRSTFARCGVKNKVTGLSPF